jgi:hypothetical protein
MKPFHNGPDNRALSVTVLRAVCSPDVRAAAPTGFREKTDRHPQGHVQKPRLRASLWADHMRRWNSRGVRHHNCSLGWLGAMKIYKVVLSVACLMGAFYGMDWLYRAMDHFI